MQLIPLKSQLFESGTDLKVAFLDALKSKNETLQSGDIVVIASKVVAYSQGRLRPVKGDVEFKALIHEEADQVLSEEAMTLTMKNHILIPNAGIDRSNTPEGQAVLWPEAPFEVARQIRRSMVDQFGLSELGIVIGDSHCQPLRIGTSGIAIGWAGFWGVQDERGKKDLFGREMVYTKIAIADNLASAANLLMGETDACTPFVIVRDFPAEFTEQAFEAKDYFMGPRECLYHPLYGDKLKNL